MLRGSLTRSPLQSGAVSWYPRLAGKSGVGMYRRNLARHLREKARRQAGYASRSSVRPTRSPCAHMSVPGSWQGVETERTRLGRQLGRRTCEISLLFRRKASAASLAVEAESLAGRDGAVANVAAAFDNASTAPITRAQPMPTEARTVKMAPLLAGRRTAALKFSKNDSPKSSRRRMTPPVASARGANFSAPTASLPPTSMSTDTPSLAICE